MKKSVYFLMMFLGLAFTACEPMEDIHAEVDEQLANMPIQGVAEYTLTEDDYEALNVTEGNFSSLDEASALIPSLLTENFPVWGEGSLAQVTFDLFAPNTPVEYTVTEEGYAAIELGRNYFTKTSEIKDFLEFQFSQASLNDYVELTYTTVAVEEAYTLNDDDFELIEDELGDLYPDPASSAGRYGNFDRREGRDAYWSNEMILEAINVVMAENFPGIEGQTYEVSYAIYNGSPGTESMKLRFDGEAYVPFGAVAYDLSNADFDFIGAELSEEYPKPAESAANFNNFDRREGEDAYWNDDMILEAINVLLAERFPNAAEGAQFNVSFRTYTGSSVTEVMSVVLEDGEYVINEEETISTIVETAVFGFGDNMWHMPLELPANIYTEEFEQRFNNFDNESKAGFYIGRWLEPKFPYAQEGDFVSVAYTFTFRDESGSRKFETRFASFVYNEDEREWEFIPTVIPYTLQFGHEGTGWVVDNTILYTLSGSDYEKIGSALIDKYPGPADNAGYFGSFDRREGSDNYWSKEMLLEAMTVVLNEIAPNPEEGQKYVISYAAYTGSTVIQSLSVIYQDGEWVLNE